MPRRREGTDLYATILEVVKTYHGAARITRMSYGAGMPVDRLRPAVDRLLHLGLLGAREDEGTTYYEITVRGHEFLSAYWRLKGFIEPLEEADGLPAALTGSAQRIRRPPSTLAPAGGAGGARSEDPDGTNDPGSPATDRSPVKTRLEAPRRRSGP